MIIISIGDFRAALFPDYRLPRHDAGKSLVQFSAEFVLLLSLHSVYKSLFSTLTYGEGLVKFTNIFVTERL